MNFLYLFRNIYASLLTVSKIHKKLIATGFVQICLKYTFKYSFECEDFSQQLVALTSTGGTAFAFDS